MADRPDTAGAVDGFVLGGEKPADLNPVGHIVIEKVNMSQALTEKGGIDKEGIKIKIAKLSTISVAPPAGIIYFRDPAGHQARQVMSGGVIKRIPLFRTVDTQEPQPVPPGQFDGVAVNDPDYLEPFLRGLFETYFGDEPDQEKKKNKGQNKSYF